MYHRVAEIQSDPWSLCVTPQHFAEHLEVLPKFGRLMQFQQFGRVLQEGEFPNQSIVITFDDGYADNLYNARPLLERYDLPATVLLTTGCLGGQREFWWDELEQLFLQSDILPDFLELSIDGCLYQWQVGDKAQNSRHALYYSIWQLLQPLPADKQRKVLEELVSWADARPQNRPTHRLLSIEEVVALAQGDLVEIGAHTVTHPVLSMQPAAVQQAEIQQSKERCEDILGRPVVTFSYPFGRFAMETVSIVREAGFVGACTVEAEIVRRNTNHFQLPRMMVFDWDGDELAKQLSAWFDD
jgi:peptidoglycan/xylan/chitin deacetylase (PgdA/CDA1 family)